MIRGFEHAPFPPLGVLAGRTLAECKTILGGDGRPVPDKLALWLRQGGSCFYCDTPMMVRKHIDGMARDPASFTIDHILTREQDPSRHGPKVAACYRCNTSRGTLPAHEFILIGQSRYRERAGNAEVRS